jgi:hypothetical protein
MPRKQNRIPGMPSKQDLSKKKQIDQCVWSKKKQIDQCVWSKEKDEMEKTFFIKFCFFSGEGFELGINRFANISSIISKIDDMIKLILNIDQDKIAYELIYKNERIDHIQQISIYYEEKYPIFVKMTSYSFYDRHDICDGKNDSILGQVYDHFIDPFDNTDDPYYQEEFGFVCGQLFDSIVLYDVNEDFSNVFRIPDLIFIHGSEKMNYGCRCHSINPCSHDYISKLEIIETRCCNIFQPKLPELCKSCNIFTLKLSELCEKCCKSLFNLFYRLYLLYIEKKNFTVLKNELGDAFFLRFKEVISKFFLAVQ